MGFEKIGEFFENGGKAISGIAEKGVHSVEKDFDESGQEIHAAGGDIRKTVADLENGDHIGGDLEQVAKDGGHAVLDAGKGAGKTVAAVGGTAALGAGLLVPLGGELEAGALGTLVAGGAVAAGETALAGTAAVAGETALAGTAVAGETALAGTAAATGEAAAGAAGVGEAAGGAEGAETALDVGKGVKDAADVEKSTGKTLLDRAGDASDLSNGLPDSSNKDGVSKVSDDESDSLDTPNSDNLFSDSSMAAERSNVKPLDSQDAANVYSSRDKILRDTVYNFSNNYVAPETPAKMSTGYSPTDMPYNDSPVSPLHPITAM
jgi:hypothetical protein